MASLHLQLQRPDTLGGTAGKGVGKIKGKGKGTVDGKVSGKRRQRERGREGEGQCLVWSIACQRKLNKFR